jgi:HTH-type transcriptional regulator, sugar sensing transcriptional regulator
VSRPPSESVEALVDLGFTGLEAEVYAFLLQESPATGYRIAQGIGKPAANTYKAIESLEAKGAVLVEEAENRLCRAVPVEELLSRLERTFAKRRERAAQALTALKEPVGDDRIYQIRSREQVLERGRTMLARGSVVALVDAFPEPLEELRPAIEEAARRGIILGVKAYRMITIPGVEVLVDPKGERTISSWPGQWVNLVVDGHEHLISFLTPDGSGVNQAIWSGSAYLSWVYHSALSAEITLAAIIQDLEQNAPIERIRDRYRKYTRFFTRQEPGYRELMERFGKASGD